MLTQEEIKVAAAQARKYPPGFGTYYMALLEDDGKIRGLGQDATIAVLNRNPHLIHEC